MQRMYFADVCALTCMNGGTVNGDCSACDCPAGFAGTFCERDEDECAERPRQNGGLCTNLPGTFSCQCFAPFTGSICDTLSDNCSPNPCMNGGACIDGVNSFTCNCLSIFFGDVCENQNRKYCKISNEAYNWHLDGCYLSNKIVRKSSSMHRIILLCNWA